MLNKLRKKLILICVIGTTTIVIILTLLALIFTEKNLNARSELTMNSHLNTVAQRLQNDKVISYLWLAQMEANNQLIISISTENAPFSFPGGYKLGEEREYLIQHAKNIALNDYQFNPLATYASFYDTPSIFFPLHTRYGHFLVAIAAISSHTDHYGVILIKDMADDDAQILHIRLIFVCLILLGLLLLALFSFWFSGKAIKPIEISYKNQVDFVAAASHELRSPLAVIQTSTEELLEDEQILDKYLINIINRECQNLSRLVSDLLSLARADSGHWSITRHPVQIDTLLLDIYDSFLSLAQNHGHSLEIILPDLATPSILLDAERINQTISILINNALAYTPPHTQIILSVEVISSYLKIAVIDHGPGIPDSAKPYVFKRFYRLDSSRHQTEHYGLGLSIAYEIIKLHRGQIKIENTPGGGATFIVLLPFS